MPNKIKYNRLGNLILITIILLSKILNLNCSGCGEEITVTYPEITYNRKTLISQDYIFNNEGLNKPVMVRVNPFNEIVVLDAGNVCFYVFSSEGKFLRIIGRAGQGPGEILKPYFFDIDLNGDIYVYESGNRRITIFSREGKYVNSFRMDKGLSLLSSLSVNSDNEIVTNIPKRDYYFTIFSRDGKILREIGAIPEIGKTREADYSYSRGRPIMSENGNYYIFLSMMGIVKVFDETGEFLFERFMDEIKEIRDFNKKLEIEPFKSLKEGIMDFHHPPFFNDVIYRNGQFYLIKIKRGIDPKTNKMRFAVYVLDDNLDIEKKIYLPVEIFSSFEYLRSMLSFEVLNNEDIILPVLYNSEVLLYSYLSNNIRAFPVRDRERD